MIKEFKASYLQREMNSSESDSEREEERGDDDEGAVNGIRGKLKGSSPSTRQVAEDGSSDNDLPSEYPSWRPGDKVIWRRDKYRAIQTRKLQTVAEISDCHYQSKYRLERCSLWYDAWELWDPFAAKLRSRISSIHWSYNYGYCMIEYSDINKSNLDEQMGEHPELFLRAQFDCDICLSIFHKRSDFFCHRDAHEK
jgi:hypothetical protein